MPPDDQSAGTPAVPGATAASGATQAVPETTDQNPNQTGQTATVSQDAVLGESGQRALERAKEERRNAVSERDALRNERNALASRLEELENATKSDTDKAIAAARKEGEQAATDKWAGFIRAARVETALSAAGAIDSAVAAQAREFAALKVNGESGEVEGLSEAVEAFKQAHPTLFGAPQLQRPPTGDFGGGNRSTNTQNRPASLEEAISAHYQG